MVKSVYVRKLPDDVTEEQLKDLFGRHGKVTKVVLLEQKPGQAKRDFGFVHFNDHATALKAVDQTEKYELKGRELTVSLARPLSDKKPQSATLYPFQRSVIPNYQLQGGYGYSANLYGEFGSPGYNQPLIYGRGPIPAGKTMVPMMLPDGRVGYVLQDPGNEAGASATYGGQGSASSRGGGRSNRSGSSGGRKGGGYGRGPTPAGMIMVPMMLPSGRVGYVLQDPGNEVGASAPYRGQASASSRGGGRSNRSGSGDGRKGGGNGRGPTPAGMTMVPMMLPRGRVGYVLQHPGNGVGASAPYRGQASASSRGGGRSNTSGSSGGSSGNGEGSWQYRPN